jgi:F-type H+-transporting ATPase subunit b
MRVRFVTVGFLPILVASVFIFARCSFVHAQGSEGQRGESSVSEQKAPTPAHESREASGEDETAQFKHSGSVQWISKHTGLRVEQAYWVAVILNFILVVSLMPWVLKLILGNNLPTVFRNRSDSIRKSLEEAQQASDDANRRLAEIESRLSRLDDAITEMKAASEKEAAAEEERTKAATAEEARRILESAQQEIEAAGKTARRELTAYAADLAITLASKQIRVDAATDQVLVRQFSQQLSKDGAGKRSS